MWGFILSSQARRSENITCEGKRVRLVWFGMVWYVLVAQWKDKLERKYREKDWNVYCIIQ